MGYTCRLAALISPGSAHFPFNASVHVGLKLPLLVFDFTQVAINLLRLEINSDVRRFIYFKKKRDYFSIY